MSTAVLFERLALEYDEWYRHHRVTAENEVKLVREVLPGDLRPCLEVGVGSGFFASHVGCMYGVDPSVSMLRIARGRGVEVAVGRGEMLPIATGSIAAVLIVVTICFLDDPVEALREAWRVLKPGGVLVVCIVPRESPWGVYYSRLGEEGHPFYSKARFYTVRELVEMAEEAGFRLEGIKATLTYKPWEEERPDSIVEYTGKEGFACLRLARR
ncbi:MAG: methyltransferase domain-containing protein [Desulfurococcales archaeon]|nr:methyltransferase domain-containing protein [Desulfurococcales archaeon]